MNRTWMIGVLALFAAATACRGGTGEDARQRMLDRAEETSRRVMAAEWRYDREVRPPERGDTEPIEEDRCRITLPGEETMVDVACGLFFMALEPEADSAWIDELVVSLGGTVVERTRLPAWATRLDEPIPYVLVAVPIGEEARAIRRAGASEGVRFVDIRRIQRRRPRSKGRPAPPAPAPG